MIIKQPSNDEIKLIEDLTPQAFNEETPNNIILSDETIIKNSKKLYESGAEYFVIIENSTVIGWVLLDEKEDNFSNKKFGFIYELFVIPEYRNKGIATKLLNFSCEYYKNKNCYEIRLNVYKGNNAACLYEKLGFSDINITMGKNYDFL